MFQIKFKELKMAGGKERSKDNKTYLQIDRHRKYPVGITSQKKKSEKICQTVLGHLDFCFQIFILST